MRWQTDALTHNLVLLGALVDSTRNHPHGPTHEACTLAHVRAKAHNGLNATGPQSVLSCDVRLIRYNASAELGTLASHTHT